MPNTKTKIPAKEFLVGSISAGADLSAVRSYLHQDEKFSPSLTEDFLSVPASIKAAVLPSKYKSIYLSREQNLDSKY
jgi:hypothetical protein